MPLTQLGGPRGHAVPMRAEGATPRGFVLTRVREAVDKGTKTENAVANAIKSTAG
jgi:hypothetical protein